MSAVAGEPLRTTITTTVKIHVMYEDKNTTCRKVLKLIEASPVTPAEKQALQISTASPYKDWMRWVSEG